ncbi:hypothetical protein C2845_PM11G15710 [Panicum miliaceum]|uniref:Helitron helicase-like domain-containing protein n=1 Tax=Panicum miliaceum TaxID=4540 RepID=A0A3L6RUT3_PANMI|nr:hypothetical protein C2845_PM11G15710 [Panicum miliaceum]
MDDRRPFGDTTNTLNRRKQPLHDESITYDAEDGDSTDQREAKRQRAREKYASMQADKKAELNAKRRESYQRKKAEREAARNNTVKLDGTDDTFVIPFCTSTSGVEDEITPKELKREYARRRYLEITNLAKHVKVLKANECRKEKNIHNQGEQINMPVTGTLQSALTQQQSPPLTRARTRNVDREGQFDSGLWERDDPMHGVEENDLDQMNLEDYGPTDIEDNEARVFHHQVIPLFLYNMVGDFQYEYAMDPDIGCRGSDPYDAVYKDLPKKHHVLKRAKSCEFCHAKRSPGEEPAFCCRKGKVNIYIPEIPAQLCRLFASQTDRDAKYFQKLIRYFNSHFSFTSFGVSIDHNLASGRGTGVYCFKAHGQRYHRLDQLVPGGRGPRHMQLYFYDTDETIAHRVKRSPKLDTSMIRLILRVLQDNRYVLLFKNLDSVSNIVEYNIEPNTSISVDQRRYNAPRMDQVAAIWVDSNDPQQRFSRSIIIYGSEDRPHYVRAYHSCYDPLTYSLFFHGGETGWEDKKIEYQNPPPAKPKRKYTKRKKQDDLADEESGAVQLQPFKKAKQRHLVYYDFNGEDHGMDEQSENENGHDDELDDIAAGGSRRHVSAREYYYFKLHIREGQFNVLFHAGRLFQQFAVDMYVKVESMRLD